MTRPLLTVAVALALASPGRAATAARPVPAVGPGRTLGVDPWVEEYQATMLALTGRMTAFGDAVKGIPLTPSVDGLSSAVSTLQDKLGAMDALRAQAKAARERMEAHVRRMPSAKLRYGRAAPQTPAFDEKEGGSDRPYEDTTLRRPAHAASSGGGPTPPAGASLRQTPRLKAVASGFGYAASGGAVGSGFARPMAAPGGASAFGLPTNAPQVGSVSPAVGSGQEPAYSAPPPPPSGPGSAAPSNSIGASAGTPQTGGRANDGPGMSAAPGPGDAPVKPAANPSAESLSQNKSDVAKVAQERADKQAEERRQDAKDAAQARLQAQQAQMQMLQQLAQQAAQLAQQADQAAQQDKQQAKKDAPQSSGSAGAANNAQQFDLAGERSARDTGAQAKEVEKRAQELAAQQPAGPAGEAPAGTSFGTLW